MKVQVKIVLPVSLALRKLLTCPWDGRRRSRKGVSRVSNTNESSVLAAPQWRARLGASVLLMSAPTATQRGIAMSGAITGTGLCAVATPAAPRHWVEAAFAAAPVGVPVSVGVLALAQLADQRRQPTSNQTHNYKYATGIGGNGLGASGPPRRRQTA
jgi:hypothetical protein